MTKGLENLGKKSRICGVTYNILFEEPWGFFLEEKMKVVYNQKLFCPGPVNISGAVKQASVAYDIGHREVEFSLLYSSIKKKLLTIFEISNTREYSALVMTGSGTAANEAVLSTVVGSKNILVLVNGEFGSRLFDISSIHNKNTYKLDFDWAKQIDLGVVESFLKNNKINVLAMVHYETSTGMLNPVDKIGRLCKKYKIMFIVDAVSSAGCERVRVEDWNISFVTTSAGKAICSMPGLGMIVGKSSEFEKLKNIKPRTTYLDLYKIYYFSKYYTQTPNTPAVNLMFALDSALSLLLENGIKNKILKVKVLSNFARGQMRKMGLKFLLNEKFMCSMLTTVVSPFDVSTIQAKLKERGFVIYKGKGLLEKKVFQVANIGDVTHENVSQFLIGLRDVLDEMTGIPTVGWDDNQSSSLFFPALRVRKHSSQTFLKN